MITLKDFIQDLSKFAISPQFFEKIKITSTPDSAVIEAVSNDREVILKAKTNAIADLTGDFGLSNIGLLNHIVSDALFANTESTLEVVYESRNGKTIPSELNYTNKSKSHINYRFMNVEHTPAQPVFNSPKWDVEIEPSKAAIQQFTWAAGGLSGYELHFLPKVVGNQLKFFIGEEKAASQRGGVVFAEGTFSAFDPGLKWKIAPVISVLKLSESSKATMSFSAKGAIQITLATGISSYQFIFPAKTK